MTLLIGSTQVNFAPEGLSGIAGAGAYQLRLDLQAQVSEPSELAGRVLLVNGDLFLSVEGDAPLYVGPAELASPFTFPGKAATSGITGVRFHIHVIPTQLEAIEMERLGRDVALQLDLRGASVGGGLESIPFAGQTYLPLKPGTWPTLLEHLGYCEQVVLLIRRPGAGTSEERRQAHARLRQAQEALGDGRAGDAVSHVRHVLELLWPKSRASTTAPKERDIEERFEFVAHALADVASAAHHSDPHTRRLRWHRADAVSLVTCVAALMSRVDSR